MGFSDFVDPYLDAETGVLRNDVGARTRKELEEAEGTLSPDPPFLGVGVGW